MSLDKHACASRDSPTYRRDRPENALIDPLSQIFGMMHVETTGSSRLEAGGVWALRFAAHSHVKFGAVLQNECWLIVDDQAPLHLRQGDCYLLTKPADYTLASAPAAPSSDGTALYAGGQSTARIGDGETVLIGGGFLFDLGLAGQLLGLLPAVIHVPARLPAAGVLAGTLHVLDAELTTPGIGTSLMVERLAQILFVQALRAHLEASPEVSYGLVSGLADPRIGRAIALIHAEPARRWTIAGLASAASMSRSSFAQRFQRLVGQAPLDYVTRWRMQLAKAEFARGTRPVGVVARSLGYQSDSAFTAAFKRVSGRSPRDYRQKPTP
ncbi:IS5 family transposase IS4811 [Brevundimonas sp. NIBR10]|uniref:AraC family transcriptional regulator n=1 Tax=Brevundimonas sp. NIBR10 TaxID=3015997 RepID=UPI0022F17691|nr:AraC family transcriptional regulator [Brevundimonas sp. NIBR10]WGM45980.1 IS5 family transposase IS4811 [Brevundimonas sp. NIBR10]